MLTRNENLGGLTLAGYQMVSEPFKKVVNVSNLSELAKQIKIINAFEKEKVGLIFRPPYDILVSGTSCYNGHKALTEEEIKKLRKTLEA